MREMLKSEISQTGQDGPGRWQNQKTDTRDEMITHKGKQASMGKGKIMRSR